MEGRHNGHSSFKIFAIGATVGTIILAAGPFVITLIQHVQSREQKELTKQLTKLQIEEMELKLLKQRKETIA